MKTIFKYNLPDEPGDFTRELPIGAQILHVGSQEGTGYFWALVNRDPDVTQERRRFRVYWTGEDMENQPEGVRRYIGTYTTQREGPRLFTFSAPPPTIELVNHLFEILIYEPPL